MTEPIPAAEQPFDGKAFARNLPHAPGVYRMMDSEARVLYVGKARDLRRRVGSYFTRSSRDRRIHSMLSQVAGMEVSLTRTEAEALLLEDELIKSLKPRYNVLLRDDKSYPFIYLSGGEDYPRLAFHRGAKRLPGEYFGPFPSAWAVRESLNQMQKLFGVRQCQDSFFRNRSRPCLQYQIKRCSGPCVALVSKADYARDVRHARMFLRGESQTVIGEIADQMETASRALDFERAAELRDRIATLKKVQAQQFVTGGKGDVDIVGVAMEGSAACIQVFFLREGRNLGSRAFFPRNTGDRSQGEIVSAFLTQHYLEREIPPQILVNEAVSDRGLLEEVFSQRAGRRIHITPRPRGERARWLEMAVRNAQNALATRLASHAGMRERIGELQELLELEEAPSRIECFDISHTQGEATVASCVVFDENGPVKSDYRRFNIRGVTAGDDYAALRQALERRYRKLKEGEGRLPDLLLIDGGKGQMRQALEVLAEYQIDQLLVVGVSKGPERRDGEEVLIVGAEQRMLRPGPGSSALRLIQWVRDEAHRFAITGHRQKRGKARQRSVLEDIPGIGPKRRRRLLTRFGGLQGLSAAGVEELTAVEGISAALAQRIYDVLHPPN